MEFNISNLKVVIVINKDLPSGVIANTSAILGMSLGKMHPEIVGRNLKDKTGNTHEGITTIGVPILSADNESIKMIRNNSKKIEEYVYEVNVLSLTRSTRSYEEYAAQLENVSQDELVYQGILLCAEKRIINKLTGNLSLFR